MDFLVLADPPEKLKPRGDTTLPIMRELLRRGHQVYYCDIFKEDLSKAPVKYLAELHSMKVLEVDPSQGDFLKLQHPELRAASDFDVILNRKDPPMDEKYLSMLKHFEALEPHVLQVNEPAAIGGTLEHEYPILYPAHSIPTQKCLNIKELFLAIDQNLEGETVVKPHDSAAGFGIKRFKHGISEKQLSHIYGDGSFPLITQPFIPNIRELGDVRILTMNAKFVGSILRRAAPGGWLSNLAQGGSAEPHIPTHAQMQAVHEIAPELASKGLYLVGFDFIGDQLSEINVTSPTCLVQINEFSGQRREEIIVNELEQLAKRP
jgi:glutathione synthase